VGQKLPGAAHVCVKLRSAERLPRPDRQEDSCCRRRSRACIDYVYQLRELGAKAEGIVSTNAAALTFLETHPIDAAILDYRLRDGTSKPVMEWLRDHQIPFVIISGWVEMLPCEANAAPILEKPLLHDALCQALSYLLH
jgi:CheY-like chemotaxis protein